MAYHCHIASMQLPGSRWKKKRESRSCSFTAGTTSISATFQIFGHPLSSFSTCTGHFSQLRDTMPALTTERSPSPSDYSPCMHALIFAAVPGAYAVPTEPRACLNFVQRPFIFVKQEWMTQEITDDAFWRSTRSTAQIGIAVLQPASLYVDVYIEVDDIFRWIRVSSLLCF